MTINLRNEFLQVLKTSGWNVYLQRKDKTTGKYPNKLEYHTVRNNFSGSLVGHRAEDAEGVNSTSDNIFYFMHDVNPSVGDRIYEEMPNEKDNTQRWLVDWAQPFRGFSGEIVYWGVGVMEDEED